MAARYHDHRLAPGYGFASASAAAPVLASGSASGSAAPVLASASAPASLASPCCIVTAYYRFSSKHSSGEYDQWMRNLFVNVQMPMVIFCEGSMAARIGQTRAEAGLGGLTHIVSFPWQELESHRHAAHWKRDLARDPHRSIHNTNLYVIWNEKLRFVERAIQMNPFRMEWFCWCDAGYFRNAAEMAYYRTWPSGSFVARAERDKLYITAINPFTPAERGPAAAINTLGLAGKVRLAAGVMFAHAQHWIRSVVPQFYALQGFLISHGQFAGREETVLNALYLKYPTLFRVMQAAGRTEQDRWFWGRKAFLNAQSYPTQLHTHLVSTETASTASTETASTSTQSTASTSTASTASTSTASTASTSTASPTIMASARMASLVGQSHSHRAHARLLDGRRFQIPTPAPPPSFTAVEWEMVDVLGD